MNPFRKCFVYDALTNQSTCKVKECNTSIKGNHSGNLQRHVQSCHKEIFDNISAGSSQPPSSNSSATTKKRRLNIQPTLDDVVIKQKTNISVNITPDLLKEACTELVTVNGRPFSIFNDSGFRKILDPIIAGLDNKIAINPENIKKNVSLNALSLKEKITTELKGKLLSFKVDGASRLDRSILGINVQFIGNNNCLVLRTLAMRELKERHASSYISKIILAVLKEYQVDLKQVLSITTDNGANMLKAVSLLEEQQRDIISDEEENKEQENEEQENEEKENEIRENEEQENGSNAFITKLDASIGDIATNSGCSPILRSVRCAAHTLQLAVDDVLKLKGDCIPAIIGRARKVTKRLRTINVLTIIKTMKLKKPIIDCATRWHSTHDMLERLLLLKDFCRDMAGSIEELYLSENDWSDIQDICNVLNPAKKTAKLFQTTHLLAGDFYSAWLKCKMETSKICSRFSTNLVESLNEREKALFNQDVIMSAIFLDPRFKVVLSTSQIDIAKNYISYVWNALKNINEGNNFVEESSLESTSTEEDEIEQFLKQKENISSKSHNTADIRWLLDRYYEEPREKRDTCVLKYWAAKETSSNELYNVAKQIIGLPMTQVSVERAFSALKYILNCQRTNLKENLLEDVLLLRLNSYN